MYVFGSGRRRKRGRMRGSGFVFTNAVGTGVVFERVSVFGLRLCGWC